MKAEESNLIKLIFLWPYFQHRFASKMKTKFQAHKFQLKPNFSIKLSFVFFSLSWKNNDILFCSKFSHLLSVPPTIPPSYNSHLLVKD